MSDGTVLNAGTGGDTIATDDIGGVKHQRVKPTFGADGSATDVSSANPLPTVQTGALPAGANAIGTVDTELTTADLDSGAGTDTRAVVGLVYAASGGAQQVDTTHGLPVAAQGSFPVQVIAGTAAFGKLAANSGVDIGDVDVTSSALPTGAATAAKQPALGTAGAASADVISVQGVASMTALKVDGSGVTQPVSGTVTANLGTAAVTNAGTFAVQIAANSSVNQAQVAGTATDTNSGNKSAGTQRVVLATDQPQLTNALKVDGSAVTQPVSGTVTANLGTAAVTNAGTFAVQDSEKIADDAAFTVGTTKVLPVGFLADQASTDSVNEGDIGAARMTLDRKIITTLAPSVDTEGASIAMNIDVDESEDAVKTSAGKILGWFIYNDGAAEVYVKFYNDTVANVVVGTTVPVLTIPVPATSASNVSWADMGGVPFSAAITIAATTGVTTADTGAPAANQVISNVLYA